MVNTRHIFRFLVFTVVLLVLPNFFVNAQEGQESDEDLFQVEVRPEPMMEFGLEPVPEITAVPFEPDKVPETVPQTPAAPQPPVRTTIPYYVQDGQNQAQAGSVQQMQRPELQLRRPMRVIPQLSDIKRGKKYRIQLGAYSNTAIAQDCFNRIKDAGFSPAFERFGSLYRVVIPYVNAEEIQRYISRLENAGFTEAWLREEN